MAALRLLAGACLALFALAVRASELPAAELREIAAFGAEASPSWRPLDGSGTVELSPEKTPDGKTALRFPCPMPRLAERAYWDRDVLLNLSGSARVALWVKGTGESGAISGGTLYFRAGAGWYGAPLDVGFGEWNRATLELASFQPEGKPRGWSAVDGIRVSFWKGQSVEASVQMGGMEVLPCSVVVVRNSRAARESEPFAVQMVKSLCRSGIEACMVDDTEVEGGVLEGKKVAVYPNSPRPSEQELDMLEAFARGGGKIVVAFSLNPRFEKLLGLQLDGYLAQEYSGQFAAIHALPGAPSGFPPETRQNSWNILKVRPKEKGTRTVATWRTKEGKETGYPAIVLGKTGAYVSHVILSDDPERKEQLLRALLGHLRQEIWQEVVQGAEERAGNISAWKTFADAEAGVARIAAENGRAESVRPALGRAKSLRDEAQAYFKAGNYPEALDAFSRARGSMLDAYALAQAPRQGEFRAVWCHSAYGVQGKTWDEAIRGLCESGFNAIVPNMLWGGVADYPSKVLPTRDRVAIEGDQIATCLAACKKYSIEMHVWKVNWNLSGAPRPFVERLRSEKRLQASSDGAEATWLCPSSPENLELETESLLEVVRKYDVDGIHFDYIRYPDSSKCYCEGCRRRFEEELVGKKVEKWPADVLRGGKLHAEYREFRCGRITRLVKAVSEKVRELKPWIRISAAVFPSWPQCREDIGQDWVGWIERGYLDFVCPMNYTASNASFRCRIALQRDAVAGRVPLYSGVGASAPGLSLDQVIDQVRLTRTEGADGFIIFNYAGEVADEYVKALSLGLTSQPTAAPHDAPAFSWRLTQSGKELGGIGGLLVARASDALGVEVAQAGRGRLRAPPTVFEASVAFSSIDGKILEELGDFRSQEPPLKRQVRLPAGHYRLVSRGRMALSDGARRDFLAKGPFLKVQD